MTRLPAPELAAALESLPAGKALDLACGQGRHALWLNQHGWDVTAVDREASSESTVTIDMVDLEKNDFTIQRGGWDLIVCWLYWQADLLPAIARGIRPGGVVALAGKTRGRFATSLARYQQAFSGWEEIASGENEARAFLIAIRPVEKLID